MQTCVEYPLIKKSLPSHPQGATRHPFGVVTIQGPGAYQGLPPQSRTPLMLPFV
jgi:hypothetical protein